MATPGRTPQSNQLQAVVMELEKLKSAGLQKDVELEKLKSQVTVLFTSMNLTRGQLRLASDRVEYLESLLGVETSSSTGTRMQLGETNAAMMGIAQSSLAEAAPGGRLPNRSEEGGAAVGTPVTHSPQTTDLLERSTKSKEAAKSKPMKDCVNHILAHLMGTKLDKKSLPPYPSNPDETSEAWPKDAATNKPYMCFNWAEARDAPVNRKNIDVDLATVQTQGVTFDPLVATDLANITDHDLRTRINGKFDRMRGKFNRCPDAQTRQSRKRRAHEVAGVASTEEGAPSTNPEVGAGDGDEHGNSEPGNTTNIEQAEPGTWNEAIRRAARNSRVQFILDQRLRKRPFAGQYTDPKYDAAFTLTAMSENEDDPTPEPGCPKQYVLRAPDWRSEELRTLYTTIDGIANPNPDKVKSATNRIRGTEITDAVPPKTKSVKIRVREWMVKPELIEKHPEWLTSRRVANNGKLWGEETDPEEEQLKNETLAQADKERSIKKVRLLDNSDVASNESRLKELLGDKSLEDFFPS
ncbi:unnamed protein product [Somion occarium]|uniref:Uncharacterized protein n=1 Tax=Somion occarium TaxID=3059160 RepID=A0ABP1CR13_9APHY